MNDTRRSELRNGSKKITAEKMVSKFVISCPTLLCGIILMSCHRGGSAGIISSEAVALEDLVLEPNAYPDVYSEDGDPIEPVYDYGERKMKRQTPPEKRETVEELMTRLPISSQNVKELLRILNKPKKSDILKLNGWSASGMPFNVLYTPNSMQQKFLTSVGSALDRKPAPVPTPQPLRRENYLSPRKEDKKEYMTRGLKTTTRSPQMRKHYLVIPQLFVSYGWGSLGK